MKRAVFHCNRCGVGLTGVLREVGEGELLFETGRAAAAPAGSNARLTGPWS